MSLSEDRTLTALYSSLSGERGLSMRSVRLVRHPTARQRRSVGVAKGTEVRLETVACVVAESHLDDGYVHYVHKKILAEIRGPL